jgi:hypothetical protein
MESVQVNIDSYDEQNHSVVAHFTGTENGVEYTTPKYAFSAANYDSNSIEDLVKKLAQTGLAYLQQEAAKQKSTSDSNFIEQLKSLNSTTHTFDPADLTPPPVQPINVGVADNLEIQL